MAKPPQQQQPRSLNQRHSQILINLSASHSKPAPDDLTKLEARRRFNHNDAVPTFSAITDSEPDSSPSPGDDGVPSFSGIADFSPDSDTKSSPPGDDSVPNFSGIADFSPDSATKSSPSGEAEETDDQSKINNISAFENDAIPNFSAVADFGPDSAKSSPFGENEIDESKHEIQEELSDQPEDSFDYQCCGIGEKEIDDEPKNEIQEQLSEPPVDSFDSHCSEIGNLASSSSSVEKEIDQPKSGTKADPLLSKIDDNSSSLSVDMEQSKDVYENCEQSQKGQKDYEKTSNEEEEKIMKIKIKGRRRLCKISEDNNDSEEMKLKDNEESGFLEITDFDSPPPQAKNAVQNEHGSSGSEIRDILNDLSSRLEILSIEKKRAPKPSDLTKKDEILDYQSAGSSFSLSSGSSSDSIKESRIGGEIHKESLKEIDLGGESKNDYVVRKFNDTRSSVEVKQMVGKSQPMRNSLSAYKFLEEGDSNDSDGDCVVVGDKSAITQVGRHNRKARHERKCSDDFDSRDFVSEEDHTYTLSGPKFNYGLPGKVAKMLYPHQSDGLKWLWSLHCLGKGGILGDDMGLGKTMQICSFLAGLFYSKLIKRVLIVAPKTLLPHWIKELTAVGLSQKIREYFATSAKLRNYELEYVLQDKGILLTTYDIVRNNVKSLCGDQYFLDKDEELTWDYMILDEGHLIKNPSTQRAKSLHQIPCAHRIIISGTPLQNNLKELWALFNFCCPGLLGDKQWFKEKYEHPILRGNDKNAYDRDKRIGSAVAKELREHIQPYFLRRLKSEVFSDDSSAGAKLSKKNEIIVWLKLTNCQRQLYTAFLKSEIVLSAFDSSPLAALTILKKICDHPLLLTKRAAEEVLEEMDSTSNKDDRAVAERLVMQMANVTEKLDEEVTHDVSCKITFILALLDNLIPGGHNVLIFSQTRKMLNLLQDALISNGFQFMRIDGTTKATDRLKIVNDFQEGRGAPIFLLTSQVGGLGLTLTKADRVIVVDPAWNPSTDSQSVDRAYRIGQTKDVVVYRLMTCGTVEEKIYRKQVYKGGLFKTATEHKEQIRYFSQQDLRELFSLPKGGFDISNTQQQLNEEHDHEHKMEGALKVHVKFLETLGIAGVSSHSLLFSKAAPAPTVEDEDEVKIASRTAFVGNSSSHSSVERAVDAGQYAFKPKDVKLQDKSVPTRTGPTESDIKEKIRRLSYMFGNKEMISKLPDRGERIQKQIAELNKELKNIRMEKENRDEVIDLDDISGRFHRVVNV
ncbi:PREDICTED: protein CHROMATIN REMODELING 24 isoform X1 [Nicotiana attenuata]|uniref:Protein chromatin remodeling 24 n=1 Tax=Nicotiana attenuata TaxID=49451 RepID=A0A314L7R6_NICAT|nr:PREDICTED: protein CHROMATIN REMODELING 24 isoform X1 [Nicotiana attenuata]OIT37119.1 protein chromatin remodeling 24 [Nicotiana attenuata]